MYAKGTVKINHKARIKNSFGGTLIQRKSLIILNLYKREKTKTKIETETLDAPVQNDGSGSDE